MAAIILNITHYIKISIRSLWMLVSSSFFEEWITILIKIYMRLLQVLIVFIKRHDKNIKTNLKDKMPAVANIKFMMALYLIMCSDRAFKFLIQT